MARGKTEAAASKVKTATALGALGGSIGGPIGAGVGAITGLIIGDRETVFPIDMIAIPAFQAHLIQGSPSFQIYIKEGEVLTQVQLTDAQEAELTAEQSITRNTMSTPKKRKLSAWNKYVKKKSNQIRFKSGPKKGKLDLKKMAKVGGFGKKKGRKK